MKAILGEGWDNCKYLCLEDGQAKMESCLEEALKVVGTVSKGLWTLKSKNSSIFTWIKYTSLNVWVRYRVPLKFDKKYLIRTLKDMILDMMKTFCEFADLRAYDAFWNAPSTTTHHPPPFPRCFDTYCGANAWEHKCSVLSLWWKYLNLQSWCSLSKNWPLQNEEKTTLY